MYVLYINDICAETLKTIFFAQVFTVSIPPSQYYNIINAQYVYKLCYIQFNL